MKTIQLLPLALVLAVALALVSGCTNIGPGTVHRDRLDYNLAVADSWKEQTLLNIVKLRYADMPLFVDVASIVSGYTLESSVNLGGNLSSSGAVQGDFLSAGGAGKYTDRPTVTYAPMTGATFSRSFMAPIPPAAILFLMQSGWAVDMVFPLTVDSINGHRSRLEAGVNQREGDDGYYRAIELLGMIQRSGAVGMRVVKGEGGKDTTMLFFYREGLTPEVEAQLVELSEILRIGRVGEDVRVTYGLLPETDREMALITRSTLQMMLKLALDVEVPEDHVAQGRTVGGMGHAESGEGGDARGRRLIAIKHSPDRPEDAFVAVPYRDHWFYIDDRDFQSKRTFAFLMLLFSFTETGGREALPLVTIPAG